MRTATPLATWSSTSARWWSATSLAISTPRFMGPGCKTTASCRSRANRAAVIPNRATYSGREGNTAAPPRSACTRSK